ncbi:MAG: hypothetical protein ABI891_10250 [Acidobacteriota bacterium]
MKICENLSKSCVKLRRTRNLLMIILQVRESLGNTWEVELKTDSQG